MTFASSPAATTAARASAPASSSARHRSTSSASTGNRLAMDAVATARGAGQQRAEPLQRGDGAEVVHADGGRGVVREPGVGHDRVDPAAREGADLVSYTHLRA